MTTPARPLGRQLGSSDAEVAVVNWNGAHLLPACLDALAADPSARGASVVVVDNASTDDSVALLATRYPSVRVLRCDTNTGFAGGAARAVQASTAPVVVLLNNDARVRPGWLAALIAELDAPSVAAVTSKLLLPDGRLNGAGGEITRHGYGRDRGFGLADDGRFDDLRDVAYGCGASLALRVEAVRDIGGFDPRYFLYYEDVDISWRLRLAGWSVRYAPGSVVDHERSATAVNGSPLHTFYSQRNRLATLTTCATPGLVLRAAARYPLTTASIAARQSRSKAVCRVRAYLAWLRWLPSLLRRRREVVLRTPRRDVEREHLTGPSKGGPRR